MGHSFFFESFFIFYSDCSANKKRFVHVEKKRKKQKDMQSVNGHVIGKVLPTPLGYYLYQMLTPGSGFEVAPFATEDHPIKEEMKDGSFVLAWWAPNVRTKTLILEQIWYSPTTNLPTDYKIYKINDSRKMLQARQQVFPHH
jgi:hypothetical protein